jgi:P4 family phage/plasmid primase-like protien
MAEKIDKAPSFLTSDQNLDEATALGVSPFKLRGEWHLKDNGHSLEPDEAAAKIRDSFYNQLAAAPGLNKREKGDLIIEARNNVIRYLLKKFRFKTVYYRFEKYEIYVYQGGIYENDGDMLVRTFIQKAMGIHGSNSVVFEVLGHIQRSTMHESKTLDEAPPHLLCLENGIYNLKTGLIKPHDPTHVFFSKLPVVFDETADCPRIKKFMAEVLEEKDIPLMQEIFGYLLWREYKFHHMFFFSGAGRNGKTTVALLMEAFLGKNNISKVSLQQLTADRFMGYRLKNKFLNINADIGAKKLYDSSIIKMISGGDSLEIQRKGKDAETCYIYAKLIFGANTMPQIEDDSTAIWSRLIELDFHHQYLSAIDYEKHKGEDGVYLADEELPLKLTTPEELSGLFNWAIVGLRRLFEQRGFSVSETREEKRDKYLLKSNSFQVFCERYIDLEEATCEDYIEKQELKSRYWKWIAVNKIRQRSGDRTIKWVMEEVCNSLESKINISDGTRKRAWTGIKWKAPPEESTTPQTTLSPSQQKEIDEAIANEPPPNRPHFKY